MLTELNMPNLSRPAVAAFFLSCAVCCAAARPVMPVRRPPPEDGARAAAILKAQIRLDRLSLSPNCIDGRWGHKSEVAFETYRATRGLSNEVAAAGLAAEIDRLFPADGEPLLTSVVITSNDVAALVVIPAAPAEKAKLPALGYQTLLEMFAERGHASEAFIRKLNPALAWVWPNPPVGSRVTIPNVVPPPPAISHQPSASSHSPAPLASVIRVSISRLEITAFDEKGALMALFPCSIAAEKAHLPPPGEIHVKNFVPHPNYTYKPDNVPPGGKAEKFIFQPGPNNPVGVAWIGLSLPGYGMHGTPFPEHIGRAESHGCFRLANWNAEKLLKLVDVGTPVVIEN